MKKKYKYTKKTGRPSKLDNIDFNEVEKLAGYGLTDIQIADFLNICKASLNNFKKDKQFLDSIKRGKLKANNDVVKSLFKRATGYEYKEIHDGKEYKVITKHVVPDTVAQIFWLCNREKKNWQNVNKVEHTGKDGDVPRFILQYEKPKK